ncbi:MAG: hypothetical protein SGILL_006528, partial [Bacillariaceae sp.]
MVFRPKRSASRFEGETAAQDEVTTLSAAMRATEQQKYEEAQASPDGRKLRRRYAFAGVALVVLAIIIGVSMSTSSKKSASSQSNGAGSGAAPEEFNPDETPYETPKTPTSAYELVESDIIEELQGAIALYKHKKSGMPVLTMIPKDPNQDATFGINFRTPTEQDDGAQFVVENMVLAGSKNYPIKDPFNQVERGSLQTYWNSWTNRDRTSFVVASRNLADFQNNLKVMIDAVFHPLFVNPEHKWIYRQEGWRLESPSTGHLKINGNAFTAAKSAQMDPEQAMIKQIYKNLFSQHAYGKEPKGEATEIVTMTYEEVVDYYNSYYHPSNGQAFCWGKQEFIDTCLTELEPVLSEYEHDEKIRQNSKVEWQDMTNLSTEKSMIGYPSWQDQADYRSVVAWVLNDSPMDLRTEVSWLLIYELLAGSTSAPVPKAIADLNLGDDIVTYFDSSLQQWVMALGVSGITSEDKVEIARNAIDGKLRNIINNGFSKNALEAAMNKIEFRVSYTRLFALTHPVLLPTPQFREQSTDEMPRGVKTFDDILRHWNYDRDPLASLKYMEAFAELKEEIHHHGQAWLLELLTRRMFDSKHTTYLDLYPDLNYAQGWEKMERDWLNNLDQYLTVDEGREMLRETSDMKKIQATDDSEEALSKLPRLRVSHLAKEVYTPPTVVDDDLYDSGVTVLHHELPYTNGISYVDFAVDISNIDFDDVVLLPLFCRLLLEGGTNGFTGVDMQHKIDSATGGLSVYPLIDEIVQTDEDGNNYVVPDGKHFVTKIVVSGACVSENECLPMFNLFRNVLFDSDVRNEEKARDLLEQMIDDLEDDIQTNGSKYTSLRIKSRYSLAGFIEEQWKGLTQLMQMRRALAQLENDFSALSLRLIKMQDSMTRGNRNGMVLSVSGDQQTLTNVKGAIELFFKDVLPLASQTQRFPDFATVEHPWVSKGTHRMDSELDNEQPDQAIIVPTRVNHVGKGGLLYEVGEPIYGADEVVTSFLGGYYLYDQLRYNQGALHAWASLDVDSGVLIYQSDRDPTIEQTLAVYEEGANWLWQQVHEGTLPLEAQSAIIGAIGRLDGTAIQPNRVGIDAITNYLKQNTVEMRQRWRDQILAANTDDFMAMVERLGAWGKPSIVVVTSQDT